MPTSCGVINCTNLSGRDKKSFFRLPVVPCKGSEEKLLLLKDRRFKWLSALRRADLTDSKIRHLRICGDHFITGKPADLYQINDPDWIPTRNMGYGSNIFSKKMGHYYRLQKRRIIAEIKKGVDLSKLADKSLICSQYFSPSDFKVGIRIKKVLPESVPPNFIIYQHKNIKKLKRPCPTAVQMQEFQNVSMRNADELFMTNGNKINNIDNRTQPILNPSFNQIKQEVPDFNKEILDSNVVAETLNTLSKDNDTVRLLYSSSIEINQEISDSDSEAVQFQTLKVNSLERDILMSGKPQSKLNLPFRQEIKKEIPDTNGNAETSSSFSCVGVGQNIPDFGGRIQPKYILPDAGVENGIPISNKDATATDVEKEVLQQCNRDIDHGFNLGDIKIKKENSDSEEKNEVELTLLSGAEIKKEIPDSDYCSEPLANSPGLQVTPNINNVFTNSTVRQKTGSEITAKKFNPPSERTRVGNKKCQMCQQLSDKYEAEQMKCRDIEERLKDADLKLLGLREEINRLSEEKMELQEKLLVQSKQKCTYTPLIQVLSHNRTALQ